MVNNLDAYNLHAYNIVFPRAYCYFTSSLKQLRVSVMKTTSFSALSRLISLFVVGLMALAAQPALADWQLEKETSHLSYGSVKKGSIGESNHFQELDGRINAAGDIELVIDLASVETWVDIRNARMGEFLFNVVDHPVATLRGQVDMAKLKTLEIGAQRLLDVNFVLDLHGQQQPLETELVLLRLSQDKVVVLPHEIIFIDAAKFDLLPGLKKLQELAKLPSISSSVPVAFHLTFSHNPNDNK